MCTGRAGPGRAGPGRAGDHEPSHPYSQQKHADQAEPDPVNRAVPGRAGDHEAPQPHSKKNTSVGPKRSGLFHPSPSPRSTLAQEPERQTDQAGSVRTGLSQTVLYWGQRSPTRPRGHTGRTGPVRSGPGRAGPGRGPRTTPASEPKSYIGRPGPGRADWGRDHGPPQSQTPKKVHRSPRARLRPAGPGRTGSYRPGPRRAGPGTTNHHSPVSPNGHTGPAVPVRAVPGRAADHEPSQP